MTGARGLLDRLLQVAARLVRAYGAMFGAGRIRVGALVLAATFVDPSVGAAGLLAGIAALAFREAARLTPLAGDIELLNAALVGLAIGSAYAPTPRSLLLVLLAAPATVAVSAALADRLHRAARLPVLSTPFVLVAWLILPASTLLALEPHRAAPLVALAVPAPAAEFLSALGAIFYTATPLGGAIAFAGLLVASRWLALLALSGYLVARLLLGALGADIAAGTLLLAGFNAILPAILLGGFFARPSLRSFAVAHGAAAFAAFLSVTAAVVLWHLALPPLALPFLAATYLAMLAFNAERGAAWATLWSAEPTLPEEAIERARLAAARGVEGGSLALRAPFLGAWQVYQGFDGAHTHRGAWRYALDFHQLEDGLAYRGAGLRLDDYHCFGRPVCSPVYGTVLACVGDVADNHPGEVNVAQNWGNHILIALPTGDSVLLAHLKHGSMLVAPGATVTPGMPIASCGNSGRSLQPHLHLHVQTGPTLGAPTRPFHLTDVVLDEPGGARYALDTVPAEGAPIAAAERNPGLAAALHATVGRQLVYVCRDAEGTERPRRLAIELDLLGRTRLRAESGAKLLVAESDALFALHGRAGPRDPFIDALALAIGLTPFAEGELRWRDAPSKRLLPLPPRHRLAAALRHPLGGNIATTYRRSWDPASGAWRQTGEHRLALFGGRFVEARSVALLTEADGLHAFSLEVMGRRVVDARLHGIGLRTDHGVPGWMRDRDAEKELENAA
jgi:urea transporter